LIEVSNGSIERANGFPPRSALAMLQRGIEFAKNLFSARLI